MFWKSVRSADSLKGKCSDLYRKHISTEDPHIPDDLKRARHLRNRITERAYLGMAGEAEKDMEADLFLTKDTPANDIWSEVDTIISGESVGTGQVVSASGAVVVRPSIEDTPPHCALWHTAEVMQVVSVTNQVS